MTLFSVKWLSLNMLQEMQARLNVLDIVELTFPSLNHIISKRH